MLRPGIEPEPIAWKAIILPLDQRSLVIVFKSKNNNFKQEIFNLYQQEQKIIQKNAASGNRTRADCLEGNNPATRPTQLGTNFKDQMQKFQAEIYEAQTNCLKSKETIKKMLRPGIEPEPIAWKAIILPLDQRSLVLILQIKCKNFKQKFMQFQTIKLKLRKKNFQKCCVRELNPSRLLGRQQSCHQTNAA
ncbi:hypothetical protein ABPG74_012623 [Tetrahymena malaccensis]